MSCSYERVYINLPRQKQIQKKRYMRLLGLSIISIIIPDIRCEEA